MFCDKRSIQSYGNAYDITKTQLQLGSKGERVKDKT